MTRCSGSQGLLRRVRRGTGRQAGPQACRTHLRAGRGGAGVRAHRTAGRRRRRPGRGRAEGPRHRRIGWGRQLRRTGGQVPPVRWSPASPAPRSSTWSGRSAPTTSSTTPATTSPTGEQRYDLIIDIAGNPSLSRLRRALTPKGTAVLTGGEEGENLTGGIGRQLRAMMLSRFVGQRLTGFVPKERGSDIQRLAERIEAGQADPEHRPDLPARRRSRRRCVASRPARCAARSPSRWRRHERSAEHGQPRPRPRPRGRWRHPGHGGPGRHRRRSRSLGSAHRQ